MEFSFMPLKTQILKSLSSRFVFEHPIYFEYAINQNWANMILSKTLLDDLIFSNYSCNFHCARDCRGQRQPNDTHQTKIFFHLVTWLSPRPEKSIYTTFKHI